MIGRYPVRISLTASTNFGALLGALFYRPYLFGRNVPLDSTTPIYLINLPWKLGLGLGLGLDLKLHYLSIFRENKENEHLFFHEFHGR